jgi:hypothetical protein
MAFVKKYLREINNNDIDQVEAEKLEDDPLDNFQIADYDISSSKVILYKELANYSYLEDVFGEHNYIFLLYQPLEGNMGHWVLLSKFGNKFEYFCSYGSPIDYPITHWYKDGQPLYLGELLNNRKDLQITYNAHPFQKKSAHISTCGRWCIFRARSLFQNNLSLAKFIDLNEALRKATKRSYDNLVCDIIPIA